MEAFRFYQDRKVTCWERTHFEVTAETYEKALTIVQSWQGEYMMEWEDEKKVTIVNCIPLYETTEPLSPKENNGQATIEVFEMNGKCITDNTNPTKL